MNQHSWWSLRRGAAVAVACTLLSWSTAARAQQVIDETEFLQAFDGTHPLIVEIGAAYGRAEAARLRAGALANPTLELQAELPDEAAEQTTIALGWQPPFDGRRSAAIDAADRELQAARLDLAWARRGVIQEMRAIYSEWAMAYARRDLLAEHARRLEELEQRVRLRAERGEDAPLAARRISLEATRARAQLALAEADLGVALGRARAVHGALGVDATPRLPDLPAAPGAIDASSRPDVLARHAEIAAAEAHTRRAGRFVEFPSLLAGWTRFDDAGARTSGPVLGLTWTLPLFDRNRGDRTEAARARSVAEARWRLAEREAIERGSTVVEAYRSLTRAVAGVESSLTDADRVGEATTASFLAGESNTTELLDALRSVLDSRLAALQLRERALAAHRDLEMNRGTDTLEGADR